MKSRAILRTLFLIVFLLLLLGTLILMLVIPSIEDARKREELGDPLAFVTSTARTPWLYVNEEGRVDLYHDDCGRMTVLRVPECVNGITVTHLGDAFSKKLVTVERIILPSTVSAPGDIGSLSGWTALRQIAMREGCTDLTKMSLKASKHIEEVYLPKSLKTIGWNFLREGDGSPTIYYAGTEEEFLLLGGDAKRLKNSYTVVYETSIPNEWLESTK